MKSIFTAFLAGFVFPLAALPAYASGSHAGGHNGEMTIGRPGDSDSATTTLDVVMTETDAGTMLFVPAQVTVAKGETLRFRVRNDGVLTHEFVLDDHANILTHKAAMEKFPDMEHDDPNTIRLEPGKSGELVWTFTNPGTFEFACLIPGHYELGMRGDLIVSPK